MKSSQLPYTTFTDRQKEPALSLGIRPECTFRKAGEQYADDHTFMETS